MKGEVREEGEGEGEGGRIKKKVANPDHVGWESSRIQRHPRIYGKMGYVDKVKRPPNARE